MDIPTLIQTSAAVAGSAGVIYGGLRVGARWAPKFFVSSHALLEAWLAREEAKLWERTARNYQESAKSLETRIDAMMGALDEMKRELESAVVYIVDLVVHFNRGGDVDDMPHVPDSIHHLIADGLRKRDGRAKEQNEYDT